MKGIKTDLKQQIKDAGRNLKWISEKGNINYQMLVFYLNGYRAMPEDVETKIKELIK